MHIKFGEGDGREMRLQGHTTKTLGNDLKKQKPQAFGVESKLNLTLNACDARTLPPWRIYKSTYFSHVFFSNNYVDFSCSCYVNL